MENFCEHCQGQRFDRARVLRALRKVREETRSSTRALRADEALVLALNAVKALDLPHLDVEDEEDLVIH